MLITKTHLRWIALVAGIPFLYFVFSDKPLNWVYYAAVIVLLAVTVGINILEWKEGERKKVKNRMIMYGVYALILFAFMMYQFYFSQS